MITYSQKIINFLRTKPEGSKKTEIAQLSGVPFYVASYYLEKMVEKHYLSLSDEGIYTINEKVLPEWLKTSKSSIPKGDKDLL